MKHSEEEYRKYIERVLERLNERTIGKYLLERFPARITDKHHYTMQNDVLEQTGSPACTDGKNVYISAKTMKKILELPMKRYNIGEARARVGANYDFDYEQHWKTGLTDRDWDLDSGDIMNEIMDIILHELTHAFNEHSKLRVAARKKSKQYQQKLQVACEIQANDGIMGRHYALNPTQQLRGVTNKRVHPETIGAHTLDAIMAKLKINNQDGQGSSAQQSGEAMDRMMKATGQDEKYEREIEQEQAEKKDGEGKPKDYEAKSMGEGEEESTDNKLVDELVHKGIKQVKELLLASLTNELKYDANADCVIYNDVKKRVRQKTYARPSKRIGMYGDSNFSVLRKGTKIERIKEVDKSNVLTVLAVDASGSMTDQQEHVASILDDLLKQVKEQAEKLNLEVHYENLQATMHTCNARPLVPVDSERWKEQMRRYVANGGNDFSCVLREIDKNLGEHEYDQIVVINLSDGLDVIRRDERLNGSKIERDYIQKGKLKWVDANVSGNINDINDAERCQDDDEYKIRQQVCIAKF